LPSKEQFDPRQDLVNAQEKMRVAEEALQSKIATMRQAQAREASSKLVAILNLFTTATNYQTCTRMPFVTIWRPFYDNHHTNNANTLTCQVYTHRNT
jgi:hypothetical protein